MVCVTVPNVVPAMRRHSPQLPHRDLPNSGTGRYLEGQREGGAGFRIYLGVARDTHVNGRMDCYFFCCVIVITGWVMKVGCAKKRGRDLLEQGETAYQKLFFSNHKPLRNFR